MGWNCEVGLFSVLGHYVVVEDTDNRISPEDGVVRWVCCQGQQSE